MSSTNNCGFCNQTLDQYTSGRNIWKCTNCGLEICENCGVSHQNYGIVNDVMHCIGIDCPFCDLRIHFEEM